MNFERAAGVQIPEKHNENGGRCAELIENIASENLMPLRYYAAYRLQRVGLSGQGAEDLVHDAIAAILNGIRHKKRGRHPLEQDLKSAETFTRYLRGVVNSLVEAERRRREHSHIHVGMNEDFREDDCFLGTQLVAEVGPENDPAWRDFLDELFSRLRGRAPKHLLSMITGWQKESLWAVKIPLGPNCRRHRAELRKLAREILHGLKDPTG